MMQLTLMNAYGIFLLEKLRGIFSNLKRQTSCDCFLDGTNLLVVAWIRQHVD